MLLSVAIVAPGNQHKLALVALDVVELDREQGDVERQTHFLEGKPSERIVHRSIDDRGRRTAQPIGFNHQLGRDLEPKATGETVEGLTTVCPCHGTHIALARVDHG